MSVSTVQESDDHHGELLQCASCQKGAGSLVAGGNEGVGRSPFSEKF